jgi:hypothetical protein
MKIDMNKKYTSNGHNVTILCTNRNNEDYPIVGLFEDGRIRYFTKDGKNIAGDDWDLVEEWAPKRGEWCLFTDETFVGARLMQFSNNLFDKFQVLGEQHNFSHCDKFDGELPKSLKVL